LKAAGSPIASISAGTARARSSRNVHEPSCLVVITSFPATRTGAYARWQEILYLCAAFLAVAGKEFRPAAAFRLSGRGNGGQLIEWSCPGESSVCGFRRLPALPWPVSSHYLRFGLNVVGSSGVGDR